MNGLFVHKTSDRKTGPIPATYMEQKSCPPSCPLRGSGCYGVTGHMRLHWDTRMRHSWGEMLARIRALPDDTFWRYGILGDLPGAGQRINIRKMGELIRANKGKAGFAYTHKPVLDEGADAHTVALNRAMIEAANKSGFTVNMSADNPVEADALCDLKIGPVAVLLHSDHLSRPKVTPGGRKIIVCPAAHTQRTCDNCQICRYPNRGYIVGFPAHGPQKEAVNRVALSY